MPQRFKFRRLSGFYAIVRLTANSLIPAWAMQGDFTSVTRSAEELSIVCPVDNLPADVQSQYQWICLKLEGPFPFSQTGVLLSFIEPLSKSVIPIFAISTFDTDYVLFPSEFQDRAITVLAIAGHAIVR